MAEATSKDLGHHAAPDAAGHRPLHSGLLHYAIARHGNNGLTLLHVPLGFGEEALVLFSSWEAAKNFFLSDVFSGEEWYVRECSAGELVSFLLGLYEDIEWVLLDPSSGKYLGEGYTRVLVRRKRFVDYLLCPV